MASNGKVADPGVSIDRKRLFTIAGIGALLVTVLTVASAYANHVTTAGEPELFNLEHVYNFNPSVLDGNTDLFPNGVTAGETVGSDVEFFTHNVPLRDYTTGQLVDELGNPVSEPVYGERDFAVMGSYDRGGVIFDITDPENPEFVNVAPCQQPRNDVGVKKFDDPITGGERVVLALSQQTGTPCPNLDVAGGGDPSGVLINTGPNAGDLYAAVQWGDTGAITGQTADLVYAGTGCTPAHYAPYGGPTAFAGKIAIVTMRVDRVTGVEDCPTFSFVQKVQAAEQMGAIAFIQVDEDDIPRTGVTAVTATIPAVEINNSDGLPIVDQMLGGTTVNATLTPGSATVPIFGNAAGSGGIGVFDITDPYNPGAMYRVMTSADGVHNFAFHPTAPFGYVSPGELPGGIQDMPIFDFTNLDAPTVTEGLDAPQTPGGIHDVELSITGDFIYAASENNYHIYDNTDPANPVQVGLVGALPQNPPTVPTSGSYAHGLFPDTDQEIMVGQVESIVAGGFLAPGTCPGEGLATYAISDSVVPGSSKELPVGPISVYNPPVVGDPAPRFCTSHFGRFAPGTRAFTLGWYIAGVRVIDFSDPFLPVEVAAAVMADGAGTSNTWAAKVHRGPYIYAGDMERGFDVFKWTGDGDAPWEDNGDSNTPPDAVDDSDNVDFGGTVDVDVLTNDTDADGDDLSVIGWSQASHGSVSEASPGVLRYEHNGFSGGGEVDEFAYTISDGNGGTDTATVSITIAEPEARDKVTGGGYLLPTDGKKINFGFNAKQKADGVSGHLTLNDKSASVKVRIDAVTSLTEVGSNCGDVANSATTAQFVGSGTFNGDAAEFRVCVADNGEPGNSPKGSDMFYLECISGCDYNTGDRTADDVIDGGNIQVHASEGTTTGDPGEAPSAGGSSSQSTSEASVLILDPMLITHSSAATELLTVIAYDAAGVEMAGVEVRLESVAPDGGITEAVAITDQLGIAVFTTAVLTGDVDHTAYVGELSSNSVDITGLL